MSRNDPMHDSVPYLMNALPEETDILHEYFVPGRAFVRFVDGLRDIVREEGANLLNALVRVVHREDVALSDAPEDGMRAAVMYLTQPTTRAGTEAMARLMSRLVDLSAEVGGRHFLPYQLHYAAAQLARAYPEAAGFFAAKRRADPGDLFTNTFYERYGRRPAAPEDGASPRCARLAEMSENRGRRGDHEAVGHGPPGPGVPAGRRDPPIEPEE